jgi:hypothetical protein
MENRFFTPDDPLFPGKIFCDKLNQKGSYRRYIGSAPQYRCQCKGQRMLEDRPLLWKFNRGNTDAFCRIYEKYFQDLLMPAETFGPGKVQSLFCGIARKDTTNIT